MRVQLIREDGDKTAPPVIDDLLTTEVAGAERARNELDALCSDRRMISLEVLPFSYKPPGSIVSVQPIEGGDRILGILRRVSFSMSVTDKIPSVTYMVDIEGI